MDFIVRFLRMFKGYIVIWIIVDRLIKSVHLPGNATYTMDNWSLLYMKEIVRLHDSRSMLYVSILVRSSKGVTYLP